MIRIFLKNNNPTTPPATAVQESSTKSVANLKSESDENIEFKQRGYG
jgi:hypothetical protein